MEGIADVMAFVDIMVCLVCNKVSLLWVCNLPEAAVQKSHAVQNRRPSPVKTGAPHNTCIQFVSNPIWNTAKFLSGLFCFHMCLQTMCKMLLQQLKLVYRFWIWPVVAKGKMKQENIKILVLGFPKKGAGSVSKIINLCSAWRSMSRENWPRPCWLPSVFPQTSRHLTFSSHRQGRFSITSLQTFPSEHGAYLRETKDIRTQIQTDCMYISNPGHKESEPLQWYLIPKNHTKRAHKGDRRQQWCCMWLK